MVAADTVTIDGPIGFLVLLVLVLLLIALLMYIIKR